MVHLALMISKTLLYPKSSGEADSDSREKIRQVSVSDTVLLKAVCENVRMCECLLLTRSLSSCHSLGLQSEILLKIKIKYCTVKPLEMTHVK